MMKLIKSRNVGAPLLLALFLLLLIFSPTHVRAQEELEAEPQGQEDGRRRRPPPNPDGDLVRQLNLTPDQMQRLKAIREQNRELRRQIGQRIRAARTALDRAIYVENADEAVVEQRARELSEAQGAQVRLQAMTELSVRRILTAEQLETFLSLRRRAEMGRRNRRMRSGMGAQPLRNPGLNGPADSTGNPRLRRARP